MTAPPQIIFEDDTLVVINKPPGLVVNRADTTLKIETLQDWVERRINTSEIKDKGGEYLEFLKRNGIVHRLDKDTSGLLLVAKTPPAFADLKDQFKSRFVVKKYLALVHGRVEPSNGAIEVPIARSPYNRRRFGVFPGGRAAATAYETHETYETPGRHETYTLLELSPQSGRTHQIRVHLQYLGHPVVSDPFYAGRKQSRADLQFCPRLFLHAHFLRFKHPASGRVIEFTSPLPPDLALVLKKLLNSLH